MKSSGRSFGQPGTILPNDDPNSALEVHEKRGIEVAGKYRFA
jgi:hypothetical protein